MASLRDIRSKIKGVATTQQITSAMKMMSTARLGRAIEAINLTRSYITHIEQIVQNIKRELPGFQHSCLTGREVKTSCLVIIGGERGLCGGFNHELHRFALRSIREQTAPFTKIIAVGRKVARYFAQKEIPLHASFPDLSVKTLDTDLFQVAEQLYELYQSGQVDEISIIYTCFVSAVKKHPVQTRLLPVDAGSPVLTATRTIRQPFDFYPSPAVIFEQIMPRYLRNLLHRAIVESSAAEQSARMTAMTSATDRAEEIIDDLKLDLNRSRQALITREIAEVIAGSQA